MICPKRPVCAVFGSVFAKCPYPDKCPETDEDGHWLDEDEDKDEKENEDVS